MHHYPSVRKAIGAAETIFEYIDRKPVKPVDGHLEPTELRGHVQFQNVSFSYPGKTVLKVCPPRLHCFWVLLFFGLCVLFFTVLAALVNTPASFLLLGRVL